MATHDYVLDNASGAAFRTDLNNALAAIVSNNSNSSSPATTYAYQWWADTSNNVLKIRNSANNAWIELLHLDGTLTLEDGSASTPALAFRDDLNTGIFSSAADTFNVATGGVERMELGGATIFNEDGADVDFRIESDTLTHMFFIDAGNSLIGIGTASPTSNALLSVNGRCHIDTTLTFGSNSSLDSAVQATIYKPDTNMLAFATAGNNERMRIDNSGRVLIGTTSGSDALVVDGGSDAGTITTNSTNSNGNMMTFNCSGTGKFFIGSAGSFMTGHSGVTNQGIRAEGALAIATGGTTERMRIDSSGNVGIGLTPTGGAGIFQINGGFRIAGSASASDTTGPYIFRSSGVDNMNFATNGVQRVVFQSDATVFFRGSSNNTANTEFEFLASTTSPYQRLNHTALNAGHTFIQFRVAGSQVGEIKDDGDGTITYDTTSDYRLKENIVDITDGIERVKKLMPRRFNFKIASGYTKDGFLAHELQEVVPEAVHGTKDELVTEESKANFPTLSDKEIGDPVYQTADISRVVPLLAAGLKEAIEKIEVLETKVATLEAA